MENELYRHFARRWEGKVTLNKKTQNQLQDFCSLCGQIYFEILQIEKYDKEKFNSISRITIEDYKQLFNNLYDNFCKECFEDSDELREEYKQFGNYYDLELRFFSFMYNEQIKKFEYKTVKIPDYNTNEEMVVYVGIKEEYYDEIKSKVNAIFMLERELKFITMKKEFWGYEQKTTFDDDYVVCGKVIMENGWRMNNSNIEINDFARQKIYQSASIINQNQLSNLFDPQPEISLLFSKAFLIYKFDIDKVCCVSHKDAFTDEFIDNENKFKEFTFHTEVQKVDEQEVDGHNHSLFTYSPVFSTLNSMLNCQEGYNEIVLKQPKIIGVCALDEYSQSYAERVAEINGVKYCGVMKGKTSNKQKVEDNILE